LLLSAAQSFPNLTTTLTSAQSLTSTSGDSDSDFLEDDEMPEPDDEMDDNDNEDDLKDDEEYMEEDD